MKKLLLIAASGALAASTAFAAAPHNNFDASSLSAPSASSARAERTQQLMRAMADLKKQQKTSGTHFTSVDAKPRNIVDARTGASTFVWADRSAKGASLGPVKVTKRADLAGRQALSGFASDLQVSRTQIADAQLARVHDTGRGPIVATYQQKHQGVEVFGRTINVMMTRDFAPVAASGSFAPLPRATSARATDAQSFATAASSHTVTEAISRAFADMGGRAAASGFSQESEGRYKFGSRISGDLVLQGNQRVRQVWFPVDGRLVAAWRVELGAHTRDLGNRYLYSYVVSAEDLSILFRKNMTEEFSYRVYATPNSTFKQPFDGPLGNAYVTPIPNPDPANPPVPTPMSQSLVTLDHGPIATNDPWLPEGATETVGNNVDAYADLFGKPDEDPDTDVGTYDPDLGDFRAGVTSPGTFDYRIVPFKAVRSAPAQRSSIVNLFYIDNWMHDFWYGNGFTEADGNAQESNLGRGGVGGDPMQAQAQDFGGRNNANMTTPSDGGSPTQQMYLFDGPTKPVLATSAGIFQVGLPGFGPQNFDISGEFVNVVPADACTPLSNAAQIAGKIALINRGACGFKFKSFQAQQAGAIGVIIVNNVAGAGAPGMLGDPTVPAVVIPVFSVSLEDGATIRAAAQPVTATMSRTTERERDGGMDNGIVAHEFFHYVSNRLVNDGDGLVNIQGRGMGEGWSDVNALILSVRADDTQVPGNDHFQGAYNIAGYVGDPYFGVRRAPYSTQSSIFPMTYKHIGNDNELPTTAPLLPNGAPNAEVHNVGEIWAETLWRFYASMLSSGRYPFLDAREQFKDYVILGLKMTPFAPTMLEARDALLAATKATNQDDFVLAANAFAVMGMGVGASGPDRASEDLTGIVESNVALAAAYVVTDISVVADGCDGDGVLDVGETAKVTVSIRGNGTEPLLQQAVIKGVSSQGISFPSGQTITFPPLGADGTATATFPIRLDAAGVAQQRKFQLRFPNVGGGADVVVEPQARNVGLLTNYDLAPSRKIDDFTRTPAALGDWSRVLAGVGETWQLDGGALSPIFGTGQMYFVPDNNSAALAGLVSPEIKVGDSPFRIQFDTFFQFELAGFLGDGTPVGFDGGVVQISVDGQDFVDVLDPAVGGKFTQGGYNGLFLAIDPENGTFGFTDTLADLALQRNVLKFGTKLAGHTVKFRFLAASDEAVGDFGWVVDNVAVGGVTNLPFSKVVADAQTCAAQ